MNVSLSYPDFPYSVTFPYDVIEGLFFPDDTVQIALSPSAWLMARDGGPLLVTTLSEDENAPFEKPIAFYHQTAQFDLVIFSEMNQTVHVSIDDGYLDHGFVKFNFADKDTAMLFKLTFGGAA